MIKKILAFTLLTGLIIATIYGYTVATQPQPVVFQGQLEAKETRVGAKVPGRIGELLVREGDQVEVGTPIMRLDAPEIDAKVAQAQAGYDAAQALVDKAKSGARPQEIAMAKAQLDRAQAGATFAEQSWARVSALADEGLISKQKRDETYAQYRNALEQRDAAQAQYDMAREGARSEDIAAAEAQAASIAAQVAQAEVARDESRLRSPVAGEISEVIPDVGEIVAQGVPIVSVVDLSDQYLVLNIREDYIRHFALDSEFNGEIPALENRKVRFRVYTSAVMPDYAIWRPTRNSEGYDMRTFTVKARPLEPIKDMRPGMSVLVNLPDTP
ncbi:efflux RND transporter periplasmic adaptor subunit [Suttonella sp. R2A3]|uniref:HlyD family secretion protein n=1 Tax=Suttonella sp. R2A3 TaxID=2908648 RepID=UPI001F44BAAA|nr:efflux RND transporter periplasmic adaptor subunit [Suttonella sp. R2A3]UJF24077.1 efflux RND transporter periplasmic adaptor subunit [Suttonella sp. R2A3]